MTGLVKSSVRRSKLAVDCGYTIGLAEKSATMIAPLVKPMIGLAELLDKVIP